MLITQDHVVALYYTLTGDDGAVIDSNRGETPLEYIHGHQMMIPGFEKALEGAKEAQEISFSIAPEDAYGLSVADLVIEVPRAEFGDSESNIQVGGVVDATNDAGEHRQFVVLATTDEMITLDGNHPLAGKKLHFDVEILSVRAATAQELEHKHVHAHGHDH